ncbi:MAG TPA: hypothetical protein VGO47_04560 [Chlamydiales bacterium]|jgi:multisubunit Na+/H+ antiporter MnhG subunit|nr:hypothetical protein [Chlamydiales bacterium]
MIVDSSLFTMLQSLFFVGMFSIATLVLIPKSASFYSEWKSRGKSKYLSASVACLAVAIFFLAANLVMFVTPFMPRD